MIRRCPSLARSRSITSLSTLGRGQAGGRHIPGFSLIWWVQPGDAVFHYDLNKRVITAWSRAAGPFPIDPPVTLTQIRESWPALRRVLDQLVDRLFRWRPHGA